ESVPVGLLTVDASGNVESINAKARQIFGFGNANEAIAEPKLNTLFRELFELNPQQSLIELQQKALERVYACSAVRRDSKALDAELSLNEFSTADGQRFLIVVFDVSQRREIERLKEQFVAMVSHELRTPLTSVQGTLKLLCAGVLGDLDLQVVTGFKIA